MPLELLVFQDGDDGRGYINRNMCKIPRGSDLKDGDWYNTVPVRRWGWGWLTRARALAINGGLGQIALYHQRIIVNYN
jgi:hypothetical protein